MSATYFLLFQKRVRKTRSQRYFIVVRCTNLLENVCSTATRIFHLKHTAFKSENQPKRELGGKGVFLEKIQIKT